MGENRRSSEDEPTAKGGKPKADSVGDSSMNAGLEVLKRMGEKIAEARQAAQEAEMMRAKKLKQTQIEFTKNTLEGDIRRINRLVEALTLVIGFQNNPAVFGKEGILEPPTEQEIKQWEKDLPFFVKHRSELQARLAQMQ